MRELETHGQGPSPRARGAVSRSLTFRGVAGTIPAGAGSRASSPSTPTTSRDHPRGRGEQTPQPSSSPPPPGPSPRARGADFASQRPDAESGTIPAGAGSRPRSITRARHRGDHPRGRGEQISQGEHEKYARGPSPRARGAARAAALRAHGLGTIPAGAGSSARARRHGGRPRDHPRGRGEQPPEGGHEAPRDGPSPRARGAAHVGAGRQLHPGTIPAGAGSRSFRSSGRPGWRDHPRGRGEQGSHPCDAAITQGPSPRARGAEVSSLLGCLNPGTIPAGAGSRLPDLQRYSGKA